MRVRKEQELFILSRSFALKSGVPSEFGLHNWGDPTSPFCLFKFEQGCVIDQQKGRALTVGQDGKAWLENRKSGIAADQQFEIIVSDGTNENPNILDTSKPVPLNVIVDSFRLDSFL
jgi:hypothetical protein